MGKWKLLSVRRPTQKKWDTFSRFSPKTTTTTTTTVLLMDPQTTAREGHVSLPLSLLLLLLSIAIADYLLSRRDGREKDNTRHDQHQQDIDANKWTFSGMCLRADRHVRTFGTYATQVRVHWHQCHSSLCHLSYQNNNKQPNRVTSNPIQSLTIGYAGAASETRNEFAIFLSQ